MKSRKIITQEQVAETAKRLSNWGRWGKDDEVGTLNYAGPDQVVAAAQLVRSGKVFSLALNFDQSGPQGAKSPYPAMNRFNPIHLMLRTGTDAYSGILDKRGIRSADDIIIMPLQCGTQWDGLAHVFYGDKMYNGFDCRLVSSTGAEKCGIEKTKDRIVGRGVLLDIARAKNVDCLEDGYAITSDDLDEAAKQQGVKIKQGDFILVRTGQIEAMIAAKNWDNYAGGDAPGMAFETAEWLFDHKAAAIAADTWGCEVRPNESVPEIRQPWHWIVIPMMGMTMGEIFNFSELSKDCASDGQYDFMFVAPALPVTGAVGSPVNPLAIK